MSSDAALTTYASLLYEEVAAIRQHLAAIAAVLDERLPSNDRLESIAAEVRSLQLQVSALEGAVGLGEAQKAHQMQQRALATQQQLGDAQAQTDSEAADPSP